MKNAKDVKQKSIIQVTYSEIEEMKQMTNWWDVRSLENTEKVIYNNVANTYTFFSENLGTLGQFDDNLKICTFKNVGHFLHYEQDQLDLLLKTHNSKLIVVGGHRPHKDSKRNKRFKG